MQYRETRAYQPGDDVRFIDWNVSARYAHPFVKVFEEERERQVLIITDMSPSMDIGSIKRTKKKLAIQLAALLAFSATANQDRVGAILFSDRVDRVLLPSKRKTQPLVLIRHMLETNATVGKTSYEEAFRIVHRFSKRRGICFFISDFMTNGYEEGIRIASKRHDLVGLRVYDLLDQELPRAGLLTMKDPETGNYATFDTEDAYVRHEYQQDFLRQHQYVKSVFRNAGASLLSVRTDEDEVGILQKFFLSRIR